jgi:hypothetical protein
MTLFARVAHIKVIVVNVKWQPKRLTQEPFHDVYAPKDPAPNRCPFGSEESEPGGTSMQAEVKGHPNDQAAEAGSRIEAQHGGEEELYRERCLGRSNRRRTAKCELRSSYGFLDTLENKMRRNGLSERRALATIR